MSWCDKLASTPSIGFRLDPNFASSDRILDAVSPITNRYFENEKATFSVDRQESFLINFTTDDGFTYSIDPSRVSVAFKHRMRAKPVSGGPPVMEMLSESIPYTQLLPRVIERAVELMELLPHAKDRKVHRIGVVASTVTDEQDMPPGVNRLIKYLSRPWGGNINTYQMQISANVDKGKDYTDRCVYSISKADEFDDLTTFVFDWQRLFDSGQSTSRGSIAELVRLAERAALTYFERLAVGDQWDEDLINSSANV